MKQANAALKQMQSQLTYMKPANFSLFLAIKNRYKLDSGIFISPYEIENVLRQHPAVAEACVVPMDDAEIGNRIRAICVLRGGERPGGPLAENIRQHVADRIARHKVPHLVDFATALPKSPVGKVLRRELAS